MSDVRARVAVVTVAWGNQPDLVDSVSAALASVDVDCSVIVVDNGSTDDSMARLASIDGVEIIRAPGNIGFAAGCNLGVAAADADVIALVNPDAFVAPDCLSELCTALLDQRVGIATALVTFIDRPDHINSAGNVIHITGLSWCGRFDDPVEQAGEAEHVIAASGACMAMRRAVWEELGGFCEEYFAYYEDADLSVRTWQRGYSVLYVPAALARHRYEFSRNDTKYYLAERNRLMMVTLLWPPQLLVGALPVLIGLEVGMLALSAAQGWLPAKLRGYRWLVSNRSWLRNRRRENASLSLVDQRSIVSLMCSDLHPDNIQLPGVMRFVRSPIRLYCDLVIRLVSR